MEDKRRRLASGATAVLAHLPDVCAESLDTKTGAPTEPPHKIGYRFDPPQASSNAPRTTEEERNTPLRTLKSELAYSPHSTRPLHPHVFEKSWMKPIQSRLMPRESPILPRSSPFVTPRRSMSEALSPYLQFLTLVALFAAAGVWIQANGKKHGATQLTQPPETATQQNDALPTKTVDRPIHNPTAIGPVSTTPEDGMRLGRVRSPGDFATLRGDVLSITPSEPAMGMAASPNLSPTTGPVLPTVRTAEAASNSPAIVGATTTPAATATTSAAGRCVPELANRTSPGFLIQIPAR